tara:strand:- start:262 stop:1425 length:1164 start_codon:yes stop_codon:yes gene_type:complete
MGSTIGMTLKPDGTKLYVSSFTANLIGEFNLTTPFDLTTAVFVQSLGVTGSTSGVRLSADGTQLWWGNWTAESIDTATLSTAWDLSTAGAQTSKALAGRAGDMQDFHWNADGTILFVISATGSVIYQYEASTPYDISTLGAITQSFSDATNITGGNGGLWVNGDQVFVMNLAYEFNEFKMTDAADISTAAWVKARTTTSAGANPQGLYMDADAVYYTDISGNQRVHKNLWNTTDGVLASARFWRAHYVTTQTGDFSSIQEMELASTVGGGDLTTPALAVASTDQSSEFAGAAGSNCFDGLLGAGGAWASSSAAQDQWVSWDFGVGNSEALAEFRIMPEANALGPDRSPVNLRLEYSADGVAWTVAKEYDELVIGIFAAGVYTDFSVA